ncbi:MAG: tetratricopeptide repeat protein [Balneolaceae bacterium]
MFYRLLPIALFYVGLMLPMKGFGAISEVRDHWAHDIAEAGVWGKVEAPEVFEVQEQLQEGEGQDKEKKEREEQEKSEQSFGVQEQLNREQRYDRILQRARGYQINQPDSTIVLLNQLLREASYLPEHTHIMSYIYLANAYFIKGFYQVSIDNIEKALALDTDPERLSYKRILYNNYGNALDKLSRHQEAFDYYLKSLEIEKQIGTPIEVAEVYNNMGLVYVNTGDYEAAIEMLDEAEALLENPESEPFTGLIKMNRGNALYYLGQRESAAELYLEASDIFGAFEFFRDQVQTIYNYIRLVTLTSEPDEIDKQEILSLYARGRSIAEEYGMEEQLANLLLVRAELELKTGKPEVALVMFRSALEAYESVGYTTVTMPLQLFTGMLDAYYALSDAEGMMQTTRKINELQEERNLQEQTRAIQEVSIRLDVAQLELDLQKAESEALASALELQNEQVKTQLLVSLLFLLMVLVTGLILWQRMKMRKLRELYHLSQRSGVRFRTSGKSSSVGLHEQPELLDQSSIRSDGDTMVDIKPSVAEYDSLESDELGDEALDTDATIEEGHLPTGVELYIYQRIIEYINEEEPFLDPNLKITEFATGVGIGARNISRTILHYEKMSFKEFINEYRVQRSMTMLEDEGNNYLSMDSVMEDSGFQNRSTFYRVFQQVSGLTPSQYRKIAQAEKRKKKAPDTKSLIVEHEHNRK